jgi:hypothetical protein
MFTCGNRSTGRQQFHRRNVFGEHFAEGENFLLAQDFAAVTTLEHRTLVILFHLILLLDFDAHVFEPFPFGSPTS